MRGRMRFGGDLFVGHLRIREDTREWRLGLIVPKKLEPSAVRRNAVKRVWRDLFRRQLPTLEESRVGHDLVVRLAARSTPRALTPLRRLCQEEARLLLSQIKASVR
jgi:ribonuclease P protein component